MIEEQNKEKFLKDIFKASLKEHWNFRQSSIIKLLIGSLTISVLISDLAIRWQTNNYVLRVICIVIIIFSFYEFFLFYWKHRKNRKRSEKYVQKLVEICKENSVYNLESLSVVVATIDPLLEKYKSQRDKIIKYWIDFSKVLVFPLGLSLFKFASPFFACVIFVFIIVLSAEITYFFWSDFETMESLFIKNNYVFSNAKWELKFIIGQLQESSLTDRDQANANQNI